jgi:histidinol phosphatase-like PHP family hydrolase
MPLIKIMNDQYAYEYQLHERKQHVVIQIKKKKQADRMVTTGLEITILDNEKATMPAKHKPCIKCCYKRC